MMDCYVDISVFVLLKVAYIIFSFVGVGNGDRKM